MDSILRWLSRIEEKELLDELLVTLTPFERTIFYEYFENRRTIHEIAEKCRYTEGAIRGAIQRIRAKARNLSFALLFFVYTVHIEVFAHILI